MNTIMAGRSGCRWEVTQGHIWTRKLESTPPTPAILVRTGEGQRNSLSGATGGREDGKTGLQIQVWKFYLMSTSQLNLSSTMHFPFKEHHTVYLGSPSTDAGGVAPEGGRRYPWP